MLTQHHNEGNPYHFCHPFLNSPCPLPLQQTFYQALQCDLTETGLQITPWLDTNLQCSSTKSVIPDQEIKGKGKYSLSPLQPLDPPKAEKKTFLCHIIQTCTSPTLHHLNAEVCVTFTQLPLLLSQAYKHGKYRDSFKVSECILYIIAMFIHNDIGSVQSKKTQKTPRLGDNTP